MGAMPMKRRMKMRQRKWKRKNEVCLFYSYESSSKRKIDLSLDTTPN